MHFKTLLLSISLLFLIGCGGGGTSSSAPINPAPAPTSPSPPINPPIDESVPSNFSLNKIDISPGEILEISGTDLHKITDVKLGSHSLNWKFDGEKIRFEIPNIDENRINILWNSGFISVPIFIKLPITINSIDKITIIGETIMISGTNLSKITSITISGINQPYTLINNETISFNVIFFGTILLSSNYSTIQAGSLTEFLIPSVKETNLSGFVGDFIKIKGENLKNIKKLELNGKEIEFAFINNEIEFIGSESGVITIFSDRNRIGLTLSLTRLPQITSAPIQLNSSNKIGIITGTDLDQILDIKIGTTSLLITERSPSKITFSTSTNLSSCGAIFVITKKYPISIGSWSNGNCGWIIQNIDIAQTIVTQLSDNEKLIPNKPFYIITSVYGTMPYTEVHVISNGKIAWTGILTDGKIQIPAQYASNSYIFELVFSADFNMGPQKIIPISIEWYKPIEFQLTIVPIIVNGIQPRIPSVATLKREIEEKLPIANATLNVNVRQAIEIDYDIRSSKQWENALLDINTLRVRDKAVGLYYGMFKGSSGGIQGMAYIGGVAGVGVDSTNSNWAKTMIHEIGHNFGRYHAPCGGAANTDTQYPYAGGVMGPTKIYSPLLDEVINGGHDIMGYCNGAWFSDYNYRKIASYLQAFWASKTSRDEYLIYNGSIVNGQITIDNVTIGSASEDGKLIGEVKVSSPYGISTYDIIVKDLDHSNTKHWETKIPISNFDKIEIIINGKTLVHKNTNEVISAASAEKNGWKKFILDLKESKMNVDKNTYIFIKNLDVIVIAN